MSTFLAAEHALDAITTALDTPKINVDRLRLERGQELSVFTYSHVDGQHRLSAYFYDRIADTGECFAFEVVIYKNYGRDWVEGWFFYLDDERFIFDTKEFRTPQQAAEAMAHELSERNYVDWLAA